jgi:hypothetical protein
MEAFGLWLDTFEGWRLINDIDWAWPVAEMIHFMGMALLLGSIGLLDLRMLGFAKGLPIGKLEALVPLGIAGFAGNFLTGAMFVFCNPAGGAVAYTTNLAFQIKLILILIAGINAIAFYFTGIARQTDALGPYDDAPTNAKIVAIVSLVAWIFVIIFGRLIMYNDTLLWFLGM